MKHTVVCKSSSGMDMAGVVHVPDDTAPKEWPALAVILCTALNPRHGNRALKRDMVREFNHRGIPVFIFDFPGVGDSKGELREKSRIEIYRQIEKGGFVGYTLDAVRFIRERYPSPNIILIGNCGGAVTALHAAAVDPSITHLVFMSLPVTMSISGNDTGVDERLARLHLGYYLRRLRYPGIWRKLLGGEINYARIWVFIRRILTSMFGRARDTGDIVDGLNACFLSSFLMVRKRGVPVLCVFGGLDREFIMKYNELFRKRFAESGGEPAENWRTVIIPDTFHDCIIPADRVMFWEHIERFLVHHAVISPRPPDGTSAQSSNPAFDTDNAASFSQGGT